MGVYMYSMRIGCGTYGDKKKYIYIITRHEIAVFGRVSKCIIQ